jgi:hypothetical protein
MSIVPLNIILRPLSILCLDNPGLY